MKILHPLVPNVTFLHLLIILENRQKTNGNKWVKNMFPITLETKTYFHKKLLLLTHKIRFEHSLKMYTILSYTQ